MSSLRVGSGIACDQILLRRIARDGKVPSNGGEPGSARFEGQQGSPSLAGREENMRTSNYRRRGTKDPTSEAVAGNGLLNRRVLLGRGAILAGAIGAAPLGSLTGAAAEPPADGALTDPPWSLEPGATIEPYQRPSRFEKRRRAHLEQSERPPGSPGRAHAASPAERRDHPERAAFRRVAWRRARYRSGQAPAGDPWPRQAAAGLYPRRARPVSDDDARDLSRMRRQQRAAVFARAAASQPAGAARTWPPAPSGPA